MVDDYPSKLRSYRDRIHDFDDRSMFTAAGLWNFHVSEAEDKDGEAAPD